MRKNMKLEKLLERIDYEILQGSIQTEIDALVYDSRSPKNNSVFICIQGINFDGHNYIEDMAKQGLVAVIVEKRVDIPEGMTGILVSNTRQALAKMSAAYFDYPAQKLTMIGITGTKGKTTTSYMIYSILKQAGNSVGLIGTVEVRINNRAIEAEHTTPESYILQQYLYEMEQAGVKYVVMEVSSQGLKLDRVCGIEFDYGVFMNIEPDHIGKGEHPDFEDYLKCKSLLFSRCKVGIFNAEDSHLSQILEGHTCSVETFGTYPDADFVAEEINLHQEKGSLGVSYQVKGTVNFDVMVDIPGKFSVFNSLAAIAVCSHFSITNEIIKNALATVRVKGRVERIPISLEFSLIIDYAHNAMSLRSLLTTLRQYQPNRLICLFGCGGNRSKDRRYEMGEVSSKIADLTVVTSDNPRFEEPLAIIEDILIGVKRANGAYISIPDRKEAIRYCICNAQKGDLIVLAGKGHESYQEICGIKYAMDERQLIREVIEEMSEKERKEKLIQFQL